MFNAVARDGASLAERAEREDELGARNAVDRHWSVALMGENDAAEQLLESRQRRIVQHDFQRAGLQGFIAHGNHALAKAKASIAFDILRLIGGRCFGDAGDAVARQSARRILQRGIPVRYGWQAFAQPAVAPEQPPVRIAQAQQFEAAGVDEPHLAGAMLDAHRAIALQCVDRAAFQPPRYGFVIANAADPALAGCTRQSQRQLFSIANIRRPAAHGTIRRGKRRQVDVVVVQTRQQCAALGVQSCFATRKVQAHARFRRSSLVDSAHPRQWPPPLRH